MIINSKYDTYCILIFDLNDLKNLNIDLINFLGNSQTTNRLTKNILEKNNLSTNIKNIDITTFDFKIFNLKITLNN